jgi:FGGY-family pentulose kinase
MPVVVAVDVGSSSARAGVFTAGGALLGRAEHPFATSRPLPDHAEHSSDEIWAAVCTATRAAVAAGGIAPDQVAGLAFDATCSLVMLDATFRPVSVSTTAEDRWNVVMWADHRAVAEAEEITATGHHALDYVGGVMSPEMELPKLLWLKRHMPLAWARYGVALDLADFLAWRASGKVCVSACTVTCKWTYLNHADPPWQQDLFDRIGLGDLPARARLPARAMPIGTPAGTLSAQAAGELGLTQGCMVGVGLIDAHAGGVGLLGGIAPDGQGAGGHDRHLAMIAGTSTCHMAASPQPRRIPGVWGPYFGAMLPDMWLNEGGQSATGALLDHVLDWHAEGRALGARRHQLVTARIDELLRAEGPGFAGALQVLPDFNGNRSPLADPRATGVIHGLTLDASFDSLARLYYATSVGIALGTRHIIAAMNARGYDIGFLHLAGGHTANPLLVRLYADATGCTVMLPGQPDSVLLGTAAVAAAASGMHQSVIAAAQAMGGTPRPVAPDPALADHFAASYARFLLMHDHRRALTELAAITP